MTLHRITLFLFVALILSTPVLAQDPPPKPPPPPPPRFEGSAEMSFVSASGNSDTQSLGLGTTITWRPDPWITNAKVSFIRSETDDLETARALLAWLRQGRMLTPRLDVFGRVEYLADEFAGIDNRFTVEGGLGYKIADTARHLLRADAGLGYAHESRLVGEDLSNALFNVAGLYRLKFSENATVENGSLYSQSFDSSEDWRFRNAFAVTAAMTRLLSLKLSHELKYVNSPVEGFEKTDRVLSAAVVAKW